MSEQPTFVCPRVISLPIAHVPSTRGSCARCREDVWMSPATVTGLGRWPDAEVICLVCFGRSVDAGEVSSVGLTPETVAELAEWRARQR